MCLAMWMRALAVGLSMAAALVLAGPAAAASTLYISGGGDGHGVGMSQYGAYGYALNGWNYQQILAHYYTGTALAQTSPSQTVRVLLGSGSAAFAGATQAAGKQLDPSLTYDVVPLKSGQLSLVNQSTHKLLGKFSAPLTATGPGPLSVAGLGAYRGALEFRPNGTKGVYTVDVVGLDDYVRGVISAEMPSTWSAEALKAQAVAARTYAITTDVAGTFYNLYPDTRSQMYRGVSAETPATDAAVAATSGQVVTYDGAPATTYFFASSGGHTENIEDAWPGASAAPWLRGVDDPYDGAGGDPYHHWTRRLAVTGAGKRLGKLVKGKLVGIRVTQRGVSPRIVSAVVIGSAGSTTVTGAQLQGAFGLLSTWASFTTISAAAGHTAAALSPPRAGRTPRAIWPSSRSSSARSRSPARPSRCCGAVWSRRGRAIRSRSRPAPATAGGRSAASGWAGAAPTRFRFRARACTGRCTEGSTGRRSSCRSTRLRGDDARPAARR